jgi:homoserine O-acetyltransferase
MKKIIFLMTLFAFSTLAHAIEYPNHQDGVWVARNFKFHNGVILPELKIGFVTLGNPSNPAVLILHGTAGSAKGLLNPDFGGELFLEGQILDANKYFIILSDAIGVGQSSKPSDGLRMQFPQYNYEDMVQAQYRLVTEGLKIKHLKLVLGNSMGGMQTWLWGTKFPRMMDYLVPMASTPNAMSGRNWMFRKMLTEMIRRDPDWMGGYYTTQPKSPQLANTFTQFGSSGGNKHLQAIAPSSSAADALINERLKATFTMDANDFLYQWESSRDYDPGNLEKIEAKVLVINSEDDERNPPELGIMEKKLQQIQSAQLYLIPATDQTLGHSTTSQAKFWKLPLKKFLEAN